MRARREYNSDRQKAPVLVVHPTSHDRINPTRHVRHGGSRASVQVPGPHFHTHLFQGVLADRRIEAGEHSPVLRPHPTWVTVQVVVGAGGIQELPLRASRSAVNTSSPFLRTVEM